MVRGRDKGRTKLKSVEKGQTRETQKKKEGLEIVGDLPEEPLQLRSVQGSLRVSGSSTGRGPSGAGSWDRAFVWRPQHRIHSSSTMAVSFWTHSCTRYTVQSVD